jgi:hypothetical protein
MQADAIVLVQVTNVELVDGTWTATAAILGTLDGSHPAGQIIFSGGPIVTCHQMGKPTSGRYYVLYLGNSDQGYQFLTGLPYWFARTIEDIRLAALDDLLPLGAARQPTPEERRLIDLAEPRAATQAGISDLSSYTRIYARTSAGWVRAMIFRSQDPQLLMVYDHEELPTKESCSCDPVTVSVDLYDLWNAGKLPPFNP